MEDNQNDSILSTNLTALKNIEKTGLIFKELISSLEGLNKTILESKERGRRELREELKNKLGFRGSGGDQKLNHLFETVREALTNMYLELEHTLWILKTLGECTPLLLQSSGLPKEKDVDWKKMFAEEIEQEEKIQQRRELRKVPQWKSSTPLPKEKIVEKNPKRNYSAPISSLLKFKIKEKPLKFTVDSLKGMEAKSIQEFEKKGSEDRFIHSQMMEAVRDAYYHQAIFASCIDLWRALNNEKEAILPNHLFFSMIRSAALMTEQWMTAKAIQKTGELILDHEHLKILEELPEFEKARAFLEQLNKGSIFTRYPHQCLEVFKENETVPAGLQLILGKREFENPQEFIENSSQFFGESLKTHSKEKLVLLEKKQTLFHRLKIAEKIASNQETIDLRIEKYQKILEKYSLSKDFTTKRKAVMCRDIIWHLKGLSEAFKMMKKFPQARFLLLHGDRILMHLQYMNELIRSFEYFEQENLSVRSHDLEFLENLSRPTLEGRKEIGTIRELNTIYGAQYPHRRYGSIQGYNQTEQGARSPAQVPASILWRLNAKELMMFGDEVDLEMTHNEKKKKTKNKSKFNELYTDLMKWTEDILAIS